MSDGSDGDGELRVENPDFATNVRRIFETATFVHQLGIRLDEKEPFPAPGVCRTTLPVEPRHGQQDGVVHAGVLATLLDHTAGGAAGTLIAADESIVSINFVVHLLRPARGPVLHCTATVLRRGKRVVVCDAAAVEREGAPPVAKATVTLAVVKQRR